MARRVNKKMVTICGVPQISVRGEKSYGGGHIYPGARDIGRVAKISMLQASELTTALFGSRRLPRPGYEVKLCDATFLGNNAGQLEVVRRASGPFAGSRHRKARRR